MPFITFQAVNFFRRQELQAAITSYESGQERIQLGELQRHTTAFCEIKDAPI